MYRCLQNAGLGEGSPIRADRHRRNRRCPPALRELDGHPGRRFPPQARRPAGPRRGGSTGASFEVRNLSSRKVAGASGRGGQSTTLTRRSISASRRCRAGCWRRSSSARSAGVNVSRSSSGGLWLIGSCRTAKHHERDQM